MVHIHYLVAQEDLVVVVDPGVVAVVVVIDGHGDVVVVLTTKTMMMVKVVSVWILCGMVRISDSWMGAEYFLGSTGVTVGIGDVRVEAFVVYDLLCPLYVRIDHLFVLNQTTSAGLMLNGLSPTLGGVRLWVV